MGEPTIAHHRALIVNPQFGHLSFWNYHETFKVMEARYSEPPLGLVTMAALLPTDWDVRLVDRNVSELRAEDIAWADVVMIGAMLPQQRDALDVIRLAHDAGKLVVMGGPDVTMTPEVYAAAEFQVLGEAEEIMAGFVADFEAGVKSGKYVAQGFPDVTRSPVPRFDLLELRHYIYVGVQFSRGCPFDCEFCSVIELNGRKPRTKTVEQVLAELEALRALGYRGLVNFVDDNLIGNRGKAKTLLRALPVWLAEHGYPFEFSSEVSLNLADDDELLALMKEANFCAAFVGIETPDPAALIETHKVQNTRRDIVESIQKIYRAGIFVNAGFIIGFDAERASVASAMVDCIEAAAIPVCMVGLLYALPGTRLERRLKSEGRLHTRTRLSQNDADQATSGLNFETRRPQHEMLSDLRKVLECIYTPEAFFGRARRVCRELDYSTHRVRMPLRNMLRDLRAFARMALRLGLLDARTRRQFWATMLDCLLHNPRAMRISGSFAAFYLHYGPYSRQMAALLQLRIAEAQAVGLDTVCAPGKGNHLEIDVWRR